MRRPQFTLRALLVAMLVVGAFLVGFLGGTMREQQRLMSERDQLETAKRIVTRAFNTQAEIERERRSDPDYAAYKEWLREQRSNAEGRNE